MKIFNKFLTLVFSVSLLFVTLTIPAFAENNSKDNEVCAVLVKNGIHIPLNKTELDEIKSGPNVRHSDKKKEPLEFRYSREIKSVSKDHYRGVGSWSIFNKESEREFLDYSRSRRVTPYVKGPATIHYGKSSTFRFSANVSLNYLEKSSIGGIWTASSNKNFGLSFPVEKGVIKYVQFTPRYRKIRGTMLYYVGDTIVDEKSMIIEQPIKDGRYCDGIYELISY